MTGKTTTTIRLLPGDRLAVQEIMKYYGLTSMTAAIRISLREVAREIRQGSAAGSGGVSQRTGDEE